VSAQRSQRPGAGRGDHARRVLLVLGLGLVVLLLLVQGFTTRTIGAASTVSAGDGAGAPLAGSRPILVAQGARLTSRQPPPGRRIALTFDDGPSPQWTPEILTLLERYRVPATFFMIGSQAVRNPSIVRAVAAAGFEIGDHTFTHPDLATLPEWARLAQISSTESALGGLTGARPRLVRPPYSSTTSAITPAQERAWLPIAQRGYLIVVANYDPEDWSLPGVGTIVWRATPPGRRGGIILMHDGGGNRAQTVAALKALIPRLKARGFEFVTVSDLAGLPRSAVEVPATSTQRLRGVLFVRMLEAADWVTLALTALVAFMTFATLPRMLGVLALATVQRRRALRLPRDLSFTPAVSVLVPAHDESVSIAKGVRSLVASRYPGEFEVIVVDDGSTDGTAELVEALRLARVRVLRQPSMGKAAALNRALAAARHDLIVMVDADTVFEPDTLLHLMQRFREPEIGAVAGNTKVGNRRGMLGRWQHIEYVMGFNLDRRMYETLGCMPTVPGAVGAFRRRALMDVGGVSGATIAEDTDVTLDIGRAGWRVVYAQDARAWTEVPDTLGGLFRQRSRWAYGTIQSLWKHRGAVRRKDERRVGRRVIPYVVFFQVLFPLGAPLIDLFAIYGTLFLDPAPILGFWIAFNALQLVLAWVAFTFDAESRRGLWALPLQQLVYRQLMYVVVIEALLSALIGARLRWRGAPRRGTVEAPSVP
jgi:cellulose synthase/poly-beta-1,6-N-acetylglucosamine synthase-like glycosyltransferase/peptidoglycan/xylan/chitin deacetylase (PgdA/CDA1 family)